jgi:hypothetical protein
VPRLVGSHEFFSPVILLALVTGMERNLHEFVINCHLNTANCTSSCFICKTQLLILSRCTTARFFLHYTEAS